MSDSFHLTRRQQFLTPDYYQEQARHLGASNKFWSENLPDADSIEEAKTLAAADIADDLYMLSSLRYTAGVPNEVLRDELAGVIEAYERYQVALGTYEGRPRISPFGLDQLGDYERALQLISLCYLLHRRDLLPRLAALIDPGYKGEDTLYEDLLAYELDGRIELDEWYHGEPYTPLIHAIYEPDGEEAAEKLRMYLENWYPSFKYVPWHDGHLRIDGTDGDYFGYWAFEAGAVAYLCEIDDSRVDHMVYPKDLVAFARRFDNEIAPQLDQRRCEAGRHCPQRGIWWTPAKASSRRSFEKGEVMPDFPESSYGATIWYREQD